MYVTKPYLPDLQQFVLYLEEIWKSEQLTNNGPLHQRLEHELALYLGVEHISLFNNGTNALLAAIRLLELQGEVITTPYSFVATSHALLWNGLIPVFADIDPVTMNLDPKAVESVISERTSAILPVHVYGQPCDVDGFQKLAEKYGLKVIYDAAHAFGVQDNGRSVLSHGDVSALSFHATKVFHTFEGGALVTRSHDAKIRVDRLKNFGIVDELSVDGVGFNGKMSEIQAAMGLLHLQGIDQAITRRLEVAKYYTDSLSSVRGIELPIVCRETQNGSYFPILVNQEFPLSRDRLYEKLKCQGVFSRRYFYPLITQFEVYEKFRPAGDEIKNSLDISQRVLCLPIYSQMVLEDARRVVELIRQ